MNRDEAYLLKLGDPDAVLSAINHSIVMLGHFIHGEQGRDAIQSAYDRLRIAQHAIRTLTALRSGGGEVESLIVAMAENYEMYADEGHYMPNEHERSLLLDFAHEVAEALEGRSLPHPQPARGEAAAPVPCDCGHDFVECFGVNDRAWYVGCKPCSRAGRRDHAEAKTRDEAVAKWNAMLAPPAAQPAEACPCKLATCVDPWEPGCGLGRSEDHAVVAQPAEAGKVRGLVVSKQIITPTCRENRTNLGAIGEATSRLVKAYTDYVNAPQNENVEWHLTLERVESAALAEQARGGG